MNTKNRAFTSVLISLIVLVSSCKKEDQESESQNNRPDRVGLLDNYMNFSSDGGQQSARVTTRTWWMNAFFNTNDSDYTDFVYINGGERIDTTIYTAIWVSAQKIGLQEVKITVNKNTTTKDRKITLGLTCGSFGEYIYITQDAAK